MEGRGDLKIPLRWWERVAAGRERGNYQDANIKPVAIELKYKLLACIPCPVKVKPGKVVDFPGQFL